MSEKTGENPGISNCLINRYPVKANNRQLCALNIDFATYKAHTDDYWYTGRRLEHPPYL